MATWTCIATCQHCGRELNRATGVPDERRTIVAFGAPLVALCPNPTHNTFSDCNLGVRTQWYEEGLDPDVVPPPPAPDPVESS